MKIMLTYRIHTIIQPGKPATTRLPHNNNAQRDAYLRQRGLESTALTHFAVQGLDGSVLLLHLYPASHATVHVAPDPSVLGQSPLLPFFRGASAPEHGWGTGLQVGALYTGQPFFCPYACIL